jgi:hypothetical protein
MLLYAYQVTYLLCNIFEIGLSLVGLLQWTMKLFIWLRIVVSCGTLCFNIIK